MSAQPGDIVLYHMHTSFGLRSHHVRPALVVKIDQNGATLKVTHRLDLKQLPQLVSASGEHECFVLLAQPGDADGQYEPKA